MVKRLKKKCTGDLIIAIEDLIESNEDGEPAENEEWIGAINRGGLVRITDDTYHTLCAIEYVLRSCFNGDTITNNSADIMETVISDADVQFHWNLVASQMDDDVSEKLLDEVANKWLAIRQHSFAKSILERYKKELKQPIQKKKPLRTVLQVNKSDSSDSD